MIYKAIITGASYSQDYYLFEASSFLKAVQMALRKAETCIGVYSNVKPELVSVEKLAELAGRENTGRKRA